MVQLKLPGSCRKVGVQTGTQPQGGVPEQPGPQALEESRRRHQGLKGRAFHCVRPQQARRHGPSGLSLVYCEIPPGLAPGAVLGRAFGPTRWFRSSLRQSGRWVGGDAALGTVRDVVSGQGAKVPQRLKQVSRVTPKPEAKADAFLRSVESARQAVPSTFASLCDLLFRGSSRPGMLSSRTGWPRRCW